VVPSVGLDGALREERLRGGEEPLACGAHLGQARRVATRERVGRQPGHDLAQLLGDHLDGEHDAIVTGGCDNHSAHAHATNSCAARG